MKTKKSLAIILAAILFSTSTTIQAQPGLRTDVDVNGTLNVSDVSYLISFIMGRVTDDAVTLGFCPNALHPHIIDLGLPSGTKWTCCNIGANTPLEYGDYYAWGESVLKKSYSRTYYSYYDSNNSKYISVVPDIAGSTFDVATIRWGDKYAMPSYDQFMELLDKCTYEWTTVNGINGGKFTGPNGNFIFMPAAGSRKGDYVVSKGSYGYYWSSTLRPNNYEYAYDLYFYSDEANWDIGWRPHGLSVRPVTN